jgi:FMN phosphatase YigB (HAD superfamily)
MSNHSNNSSRLVGNHACLLTIAFVALMTAVAWLRFSTTFFMMFHSSTQIQQPTSTIHVFALDGVLFSNKNVRRSLSQRWAFEASLLNSSDPRPSDTAHQWFHGYSSPFEGLLSTLKLSSRLDALKSASRVYRGVCSSLLSPDASLRALLLQLKAQPNATIVLYSNSPALHADECLEALGVADLFDREFTIEDAHFVGKPDARALTRFSSWLFGNLSISVPSMQTHIVFYDDHMETLTALKKMPEFASSSFMWINADAQKGKLDADIPAVPSLSCALVPASCQLHIVFDMGSSGTGVDCYVNHTLWLQLKKSDIPVHKALLDDSFETLLVQDWIRIVHTLQAALRGFRTQPTVLLGATGGLRSLIASGHISAEAAYSKIAFLWRSVGSGWDAQIHILTPEEEGLFSYYEAVLTLNQVHVVMMEIGGQSVQFTVNNSRTMSLEEGGDRAWLRRLSKQGEHVCDMLSAANAELRLLLRASVVKEVVRACVTQFAAPTSSEIKSFFAVSHTEDPKDAGEVHVALVSLGYFVMNFAHRHACSFGPHAQQTETPFSIHDIEYAAHCLCSAHPKVLLAATKYDRFTAPKDADMRCIQAALLLAYANTVEANHSGRAVRYYALNVSWTRALISANKTQKA